MKSPPLCPECGKPCWRDNHLKVHKWEVEDEHGVRKKSAVCMHCSRMWMLVRNKCVEPTQKEFDVWFPILMPFMLQFAHNRMLRELAEATSDGNA